MLGVKSTCKDRWRQVLTEATRMDTKHLLTLETAISKDQPRQMQQHGLQLVVPRKLQSTYAADQIGVLMEPWHVDPARSASVAPVIARWDAPAWN
jgi:hypothetical protein